MIDPNDNPRFLSNVDPVVVSADRPLRISPAGMRALTKATGRTMTELMEDDADRLQVMAFLELGRRALAAGHPVDAGELWAAADDVEVDFVAPAPLDPFDGASSTTSPPSAGTGE
jgi:hypothetical protein